ncbi:S1 RNA-binding domain-containing protein [Candidatus Izemoplasma sp. B36]|uniref:S1 RNA-binding domain-containing protein n=1 Tax=Candidatus Izemoplasma sp. B36 TaxID=3242468 RepID=UPI003558D150
MKAGDIVKGRITSIKPYGAFVKVDESIDGLIHISEISDRFVRSIEDYLSVGDIVTLKVLSVSREQKLSLSYKSENKNGRKKRETIELVYGFKPLADQLDIWIKDYLKNDI